MSVAVGRGLRQGRIGRLVIALAIVLSAGVFGATAAQAAAALFETKATHAILMDSETGTVLFQRDADEKMPPASLAKLMTSAVIFDAVKSGKLNLNDEFVVSENAWRKGGTSSGGSTMFAKLNSSIRLEDLMRGIIVQSGNDACIVVAE